MSQALHMLNGATIQSKIQQGNVIGRMLSEGKSPQQVVEELYIRCLTRKPTPSEVSQLNTIMAEEKDAKVVLEDVFWALLNSREFVFNH